MEGGGYAALDRAALRRQARPDRGRVRDRARPRAIQLTDDIFDVETAADGLSGALPLTEEFLRDSPSGDVFGLTQNAGMGWKASRSAATSSSILSTQGGMRADDGTPIALGYHTGHWEVGLLVREAARSSIAWAGCRSRSRLRPVRRAPQGTTGMFDSLPVPQRRGGRLRGSSDRCPGAAA